MTAQEVEELRREVATIKAEAEECLAQLHEHMKVCPKGGA